MLRPHPEDRTLLLDEAILHVIHDATTSAHTLHAFKLVVALDGELWCTTDGGAASWGGAVLLVAPDVPHVIGGTGPCLALMEIAESPRARAATCAMTAPVVAPDARTAARLLAVAREAAPHLPSPAAGQALLAGLYGAIPSGAPPALDRRVARALAALRGERGARPRLDELAREARLSRAHLSRLAHLQIGTTLQRYALLHRALAAVEALASGRLTIAQAAADAGFADHAHFTRAFRAAFGQPPSMIPERPVIVSTPTHERNNVQARVGPSAYL